MSHQHHHEHDHHHVAALQSLNGVFVVSIILNLAFVCVEAVVGLIYNSLGLLSDAGHNLSDVFSLLLALIAFRLAKLPRTGKYTYGYKKSTLGHIVDGGYRYCGERTYGMVAHEKPETRFECERRISAYGG